MTWSDATAKTRTDRLFGPAYPRAMRPGPDSLAPKAGIAALIVVAAFVVLTLAGTWSAPSPELTVVVGSLGSIAAVVAIVLGIMGIVRAPRHGGLASSIIALCMAVLIGVWMPLVTILGVIVLTA